MKKRSSLRLCVSAVKYFASAADNQLDHLGFDSDLKPGPLDFRPVNGPPNLSRLPTGREMLVAA
jgi:hypothetical protein